MTDQRPSLPALESLLGQGRPREAVALALRILAAIDARYGRLDDVALGPIAADGNDEDIALVFATRFAAALAQAMSDFSWELTAGDFERLIAHHRWIDLIFSLSGFRGSDHLLPLLSPPGEGGEMAFSGENFRRLLAMLSLNARAAFDLEQFRRSDADATALAFLNYAGSRYVFGLRAFALRERLLEYLPEHLDGIQLGEAALSRLSEIYMHCSYAVTPQKHAVKRALMHQMRQACLAAGCVEIAAGGAARKQTARPTIVVVAEHFVPGHAVHRSHARAIASLRARFHVVGIVHPDAAPVRKFFDEILPQPPLPFLALLRHYTEEIAKWQPAMIFYAGVGMVPHVIGLASLRLAPVQCVSFGHTATTMSPAMDYFVLPEDFAGAADTFSEKILALPKAAMPFTPRGFVPCARPPADGITRIAIAASTMKLNPLLFEALARIAAAVRTPAEFHFFPLAGTGLAYVALARAVRAAVPRSVVFPEAPHDVYMERLGACDLFLSPFPYGNMNSILDAFRLGLPGVCLDGRETHAHADAAIFARIGLPESLAAQSIADYVAATVRLIDDGAWRAQCRATVANADLDAAFFTGDERLFAEALAGLI